MNNTAPFSSDVAAPDFCSDKPCHEGVQTPSAEALRTTMPVNTEAQLLTCCLIAQCVFSFPCEHHGQRTGDNKASMPVAPPKATHAQVPLMIPEQLTSSNAATAVVLLTEYDGGRCVRVIQQGVIAVPGIHEASSGGHHLHQSGKQWQGNLSHRMGGSESPGPAAIYPIYCLCIGANMLLQRHFSQEVQLQSQNICPRIPSSAGCFHHSLFCWQLSVIGSGLEAALMLKQSFICAITETYKHGVKALLPNRTSNRSRWYLPSQLLNAAASANTTRSQHTFITVLNDLPHLNIVFFLPCVKLVC